MYIYAQIAKRYGKVQIINIIKLKKYKYYYYNL